MKTTFIRALASSDKARDLALSIHGDAQRIDLDPTVFGGIVGSPFAYWLSPSVLRLFRDLPPYRSESRTAVVGLQTADDDRFVRLNWEVPSGSSAAGGRWSPFAKGGDSSTFYAPIPTVVQWHRNGAEIWAFYEANRARTGGMVKNPDYYFRPSLTWVHRAHRFSPQALPAGCIFSLRSYCAAMRMDELLPALAVFSSSVFDYLFKSSLGQFGHPEFIVGILVGLPWPHLGSTVKLELAALARRAWSLKRSLDTRTESRTPSSCRRCSRFQARRSPHAQPPGMPGSARRGRARRDPGRD